MRWRSKVERERKKGKMYHCHGWICTIIITRIKAYSTKLNEGIIRKMGEEWECKNVFNSISLSNLGCMCAYNKMRD